MKPIIRYTTFWLLSLSWGLPMSLVGFIFLLVNCLTFNIKEIRMNTGRIVIRLKKSAGSVSMGGFVFLDPQATSETERHEIGHTVQNYIWGFLFPLVIGLPSIIRAAMWNRTLKKNTKADYYSIWFEGEANELGLKVVLGDRV